MQITYVEKKTVDDLRVSTFANDQIFFIRENQLFSKNIYSYDMESPSYQKFEDKVDHICFFDGFLFVTCGSQLFKYKIIENKILLKNTYKLIDAPIKIFLYDGSQFTENRGICFLYKNKKVELFIKDIENVTVCCKGNIANDDDIIDFFVNGTSSWFLARSGNVYHSHSFILTRNILLNKPSKILPEPLYFSGNACNLLIYKNNMYISYKDGFEAYKIHKDILILDYTYKTINFELYVFKNIFCVEDNLLVVDKAPKVIANIRLQKLFGNIGVSIDKIVFIKEEERLLEKKTKLFKEEDTENVTKEMFKILRTEFNIPNIPNEENPEKALLIIQKVVNEFEDKILDGFRKIYFELLTLNESFDEKAKGLEIKNMKILKRVDNLDERRNVLIHRMMKVKNMTLDILSKIKIDRSCIDKIMKQVNESIDKMQPKRYAKYAKILKMQREMLIKRII